MRVQIITLGCKVNQFESSAMERALAERGHTVVDSGADCCVVNTCAVTAVSDKKSRAAARRAANLNPGALIAVCGCGAQTAPDAYGPAALVRGTGGRMDFIGELERAFNERSGIKSAVREPDSEFEPLRGGALSGRARALLKIQDGCDNFCAYCVIPYARGRSRSMPFDFAVSEAQRLYGEGYSEIVLTGIEISDYGLPEKPRLAELIRAVSSAAPGVRIRLGSLEPRTVTREFCEKLSDLRGLCPHFHLSLQSGSDAVLLRMGRRYDAARFYESAALVRKYFNAAVTTDIIAGFPGETEEEHRETLAFVEKCGFARVHVFPYSRRPGTPAASMGGQLTRAVKSARAAELTTLAGRLEREYAVSYIGMTLPVLFETEANGASSGHTANYLEVSVNAEGLRAKTRDVLIKGYENGLLTGCLV